MSKGRTASMALLAARFGRSARFAPINFTKPQFRDLKATESILRPCFASQGQLCPIFTCFLRVSRRTCPHPHPRARGFRQLLARLPACRHERAQVGRETLPHTRKRPASWRRPLSSRVSACNDEDVALYAVREMILTRQQLVKRNRPSFRLAFLFDRAAYRAGLDRDRLRGGGGVHHGLRLGLAGLLPGHHRHAYGVPVSRV